MIGYKGLIDLCYRSGEVSTVQAHTVYENDTFEYELGLDNKLRHVPASSGRGVPTHAQRYSKSYDSGPWQTNFEEMAKKTVLKKVLKYAPMKTEFARSFSADESIKTQLDADMLSLPNEAYIEAEATVNEETGEVIEVSKQAVQ